MGTFTDLTGQRFGRYTVIKRAEDQISPSGKHRVMWLCKCDCGNTNAVLSAALVSGHTVSCGCFKKDHDHTRCMTHGATLGHKPTRLYKVWDGMKARCYNPHKAYYAIYGGRGISMCDEWHYSFEAFQKWAYENGYDDSLTIDRIDTDGDYCPENCRWATIKEQSNNKRNNVFISYKGETHTIAEWSEITGIPFHTIRRRYVDGWSVEDVLLKPLKVDKGGKRTYVPSKLS